MIPIPEMVAVKCTLRGIMAKAMTLRLNEKQAREIQALAEIEGVSMSEAIRQALADQISAKKKDPEFRRQVQNLIARNKELLEMLA